MDGTGFWRFLITTCVIPGIHGQTVEMDDGKWGYAGSKVDLRCRFVNSLPPVKISQVTWQKLVNGTKQNVAIANPSLGVSVAPPYRDRVAFKNGAVRRRTPTLEDTTITFSSLRLSDESSYICEYTTFPAGNRENTVNLTVYVRPTTRMSLSTPTLVARSSNLKIPVATCISANGKPAGSIKCVFRGRKKEVFPLLNSPFSFKNVSFPTALRRADPKHPRISVSLRWETRTPGEATTREYRNSDGTFTVQSEYVLVPSRETHKETLTCVTTYNQEVFTDSVTLDVQYEPDVSVDGFDGNWYLNRENVQLSCRADANPAVSLFQWRRVNGSIPNNADIRDNVLTLKGPVTYDMQGIYVCDATNSIGTRSGSVEISIIEKPLPQIAPGDVISVIALLLAAGVLMGITVTVLVLKIRSRKGSASNDSPSIRPCQPIRKRPADDIQHSGRFYEELPNPADYVSYRLARNTEDDPEPYSPPINAPQLSFLPQQPYPPPQPTTAAGGADTPSHTSSPPSHTAAIFKYPSVPVLCSPPPGVAAYTFPKEQYV
ncbi:nectin-1-like isoform X1 [Pseudoliparis swirei]|uniref:nectin-1-like isoform X1 n=1 Tax=Pseudoliparis swirei TaxID=2059687 RepID=UPI0024BE4FAA|nr:nectin-1-like isoform X1 [Pseudoliparis swirei]